MNKLKLKYHGEVRDTGLHIFRRKDFDKDVLNFIGKKVIITIEKKTKQRSNPQNAYYFGVVVPLCREGLNEVGYRVDLEQTHDFLREQFSKIELVNENTGEIIKTTGSTAKMTTSEFMDYIAEIQQWAIEFLGVNIPDPEEQKKLEI